jgi:hypothetical protein
MNIFHQVQLKLSHTRKYPEREIVEQIYIYKAI